MEEGEAGREERGEKASSLGVGRVCLGLDQRSVIVCS